MSPTTLLSPAEARVLATLMEKARTVPDSYPLTLNALVAGCNQKTSREPVTDLGDGEVLAAIDALKASDLVFESSGGRATRYEHNALRALGLGTQHAALLGVLALRGPQTVSELRLNAERWHRFADAGSVVVFLEELADRDDSKGGALVRLLPRAPGAREARWTHLLTSEAADLEPNTQSAQAKWTSNAIDMIADEPPFGARIAALEAEMADLRRELASLREQLGG